MPKGCMGSLLSSCTCYIVPKRMKEGAKKERMLTVDNKKNVGPFSRPSRPCAGGQGLRAGGGRMQSVARLASPAFKLIVIPEVALLLDKLHKAEARQSYLLGPAEKTKEPLQTSCFGW